MSGALLIRSSGPDAIAMVRYWAMELELVSIAAALFVSSYVISRYLRRLDGRGLPRWHRVLRWLRDVLDALWGAG
jgi:hypothetical protein